MMKKSWKVLTVISMVVYSLVLFVGAAYAQGPQGDPPAHRRGGQRGAHIATVIAKTLGLSPEELKAELKGGNKLEEIAEAQGVGLAEIAEALYAAEAERLEAAVAGGKLDEAKAAEILARLAQRRDACVNDGACNFRPHRKPNRPAGRRAQLGQALARALAMGPQDLAQALKEGQTIEQIAAGRGLTLADLAEALYAQGVERIETALAEGKINQAKAGDILAELAQRRDACVNDGVCKLMPQRHLRNR